MTEYVNIRIKKSTKKRLDILSEYLGRNILETISDSVASLQARIMLSHIKKLEQLERQKLSGKLEKSWKKFETEEKQNE